jgi:hypothetical protein
MIAFAGQARATCAQRELFDQTKLRARETCAQARRARVRKLPPGLRNLEKISLDKARQEQINPGFFFLKPLC